MVRKPKSVALNFIMNFLLTASAVVFPLITFPYVSRVLGPQGTGSVAMGTSLVSYFTMIAMLGIPTYGIRATASVRDNKTELSRTVQELLIINLGMSVVAYVSLFLTILLVPSFQAQKTMYSVCSIAIILNVIGVNWVYQGLEEYTYITVVSLLFKVLALILMFALVRSSQDAIWYALATVIGGFGSGLINFFRLRRFITLRPLGPYHFRCHLKPILTFFAMSVATTVYTNLDVVMLGVIKNNEQVGYYNAAIKVKTIMVQLVTSLGTVLLPRLSWYLSHGKKREFNRLVARAFSFVLLFSLPVCVYLSLFAKDAMLLLSGAAYLPAVPCMIVLMPTIALIGLSNITGIQILVPQNRENMVLYSVILGAVIDFVLNLMLIPLWGPTGAAIGTMAAETAVLLFQVWVLRGLLKKIAPYVENGILAVSMVLFVILAVICRMLLHFSPFVNLLISGLLCFALYGVALLWMKERILTGLLQKMLCKVKA